MHTILNDILICGELDAPVMSKKPAPGMQQTRG